MQQDQIKRHIASHYALGEISHIEPLVSYSDQNYKLILKDNTKWVLKISFLDESLECLDMENKAMELLQDALPIADYPSVKLSNHNQTVVPIGDQSSRLISWLEGEHLNQNHINDPKFLYELAVFVAQSNKVLKKFSHPAMKRDLSWDLYQVDKIKHGFDLIPFSNAKKISESIFRKIKSNWNLYSLLPKSVIHNDINESNLLITKQNNEHRFGLIDFGDMTYTQTINELAILLAYIFMLKPSDIENCFKTIVIGYQSINPLSEKELSLLWDLIGLRCAVSLSHASVAAKENPDNEYCQKNMQSTVETLELLY